MEFDIILVCSIIMALLALFFVRSSVKLAISILTIFLFAFATLLIFMNLEFLAICFLLVYVGAIAVLIIFALMVIGLFRAKREKEDITALLCNYVINSIAVGDTFLDYFRVIIIKRVTIVTYVFENYFVAKQVVDQNDIYITAKILYEEHPEVFISCALILLAAIFGIIAMVTPTK